MKIDIERLLCSLIECNTKSEHKYNWLADDIITSLRDQGLIYKDGQIIPKLRESEDEKIRKEIIDFLELPHPQFVGKRDHEKWIAWLEKQGTPAKLSEEEQNRFAKGVLTSCAMSFINYLDAHKYEGKMCVSNGECEDIENAFHNAMWDRLHRYYCKYIEKQGEQKSIDNLTPQEAMDIAVEKCFNEQKPVDNAEPKLNESEDEKIRKVLVGYFKGYKEVGTIGAETFNGIPTDNILAWLEKQGEKDKLIKELGEYKVKYTQEVLKKTYK